MKKIIIIFFILFVVVYFFREDINNIITGKIVEDVTEEKMIPQDFGEIEILFCQVNDCEGKLIEIIEKSDKIDCAFYDLDLEKLMSSLNKKEYRLVVDDANMKDVTLSNVKTDKSGALMHNKFCVFDKTFIITGSMNPTVNDVKRNDNNLVFIESRTLAENYENEFNEMWNGNFGVGDKVENSKLYFNGNLIENYFCPEDACEENVINLIKNTKERVYFMTFSFTSDRIGEEIIKNYYYGIDVKGVFDNSQAGSKYSEFYKMNELGMNVLRDKNKGFMHHKVFIIDDAVVLGSYNPTGSGNNKNDENVLIIHDKNIVEKFVEEFERVYEKST